MLSGLKSDWLNSIKSDDSKSLCYFASCRSEALKVLPERWGSRREHFKKSSHRETKCSYNIDVSVLESFSPRQPWLTTGCHLLQKGERRLGLFHYSLRNGYLIISCIGNFNVLIPGEARYPGNPPSGLW